MPKRKKASQPGKMSEIMMEMLERLLLDPKAAHSSEAVHVALFFANLAWNECIGLGAERRADQEHLADLQSRQPETVGRIEVERHRRHG